MVSRNLAEAVPDDHTKLSRPDHKHFQLFLAADIWNKEHTPRHGTDGERRVGTAGQSKQTPESSKLFH